MLESLDSQIISLWLNGWSVARIAERLDCSIEYVNQVVESEIYHNSND